MLSVSEHSQLLQDAKRDLKKSKRKDYYKILGLGKDATDDEIKKAYRKHALQHHPGQCAVLSTDLCPSAAWRRGVVASVVRRMNEVTLRRARLVLGWVYHVFGRVYHHGM